MVDRMDNVISELKYFNKEFPRTALEKAISNKEETTQILLSELDQMLETPEIITEDDDYMLHIYAIHLLAQFREKEAFQRIIELVSFSPEQVDFMLGDIITEDLNSILYSTFDGDLTSLKNVIENPMVNIYVRGAALDVYGKLYSDGVVTKEEFINYLRELLYGDNNYGEGTDLATTIQGVVTNKHLFEMIDDIQTLYDEQRIEEGIVGSYDSFIDFIYSYEFDRESVGYIDDVIESMYWWPSFEQSEADKLEKEKKREELYAELERTNQQEQTAEKVQTTVKVGRNDPCPCGSGKKYKKCCMKKDKANEKYQEPIEVQRKWLKDYPKVEGERKEHEVRITDDFDEASIEIDRLVYLALRHRARPMWEKWDRDKEKKIRISYLVEAFNKFREKCTEENIQTFEEYDSQYKIHYRSKEWVIMLARLIEENNLTSKYEKILEGLSETMNEFA